MRSLRVHSQRHPRGPIKGRRHPSFLRWALHALASISGLAVAEGPRWALRLPLIVATPLLALALWWQPTGHAAQSTSPSTSFYRLPPPQQEVKAHSR
jgi:hypothetical protein